MRVVYTTWRYGGQIDNSTYHAFSATHDGDVLTLVDVDMAEKVPQGDFQVNPIAAQVTLTVCTGDTYAVYNCVGCALHP